MTDWCQKVRQPGNNNRNTNGHIEKTFLTKCLLTLAKGLEKRQLRKTGKLETITAVL
jgi:hypothetical protein